MASWTTYKGLDVPDVPTGDAGINLKDDLTLLADRAPYNAGSDPTVNDDSGDDFAEGSLWFNINSQTMWVCMDPSLGAAKWRSLYRRIDNAIILAPQAGTGGGSDGRALQLDDSGDTRGTNAVDLQRTRANSTQVASGTNAALLGGENNKAFSIGSVVAGGKGNIAGGGLGTITNISTGNPAVVTSTGHGLISGATIAISGTNSTPSINGNRVVNVTGVNTFSVPVNVTGSGNAGSWTTNTLSAYAFVAGGQNNKAQGKGSHAEGFGSKALGSFSHAEGWYSTASGNYSHSEGNATASGVRSHAEGINSIADGLGSHAECSGRAYGTCSHAEGLSSVANSMYSHVEGFYTYASGVASHTEGNLSIAFGNYSHAEGSYSIASGDNTHAGGVLSRAHLWGQWARASGSHDFGQSTAQATITQLFRLTTNASATELTLDGTSPSSASRFTLLDGQAMSCFVNIVGRKENAGANDHASFLRQVCIRRDGSTTSLVGGVQTVGVDINPAGWGGVTITADDTNESLKIEVTGAASTDIRWTAVVFASEVLFAAI